MKKRILLIIIMNIILFSFVSAQDNHNYITPKGTEVLFRNVQNADRITLKMSEINALPSGTDGLCISFWLRTNLFKQTSPLKLLSFSTSTEVLSFIDVLYDKGTLTIRRKHSSGSQFYYDYNLYDPLFTIGDGVSLWKISILFTSDFFWIETRDARLSINNKYHNPIFFGINLPARNFMQDFLSRSENAKVIFGDPSPKVDFSMPEDISVNAFKYSDLKKELQDNFCDPL